jgi:AcrR family transcriptional regulator
MTGLRAKHKADRNSRILEAASRQFREAGFEETRIEAIAAEAQVSIGTIYNYYQNKGDILVAIVFMEVNEVLEAGKRIIEKPPRNAEKAIDALIATYIEHSLVYLSKEMWRQAMATSTQQPIRQVLRGTRPGARRTDTCPDHQTAGAWPGAG